MLPQVGSTQSISFRPELLDTFAGALRRHWKNWREGKASILMTACREMDSQFVCRLEEIEHQQRLATHFAKVCRRHTLPTVVAKVLLCFS